MSHTFNLNATFGLDRLVPDPAAVATISVTRLRQLQYALDKAIIACKRAAFELDAGEFYLAYDDMDLSNSRLRAAQGLMSAIIGEAGAESDLSCNFDEDVIDD